MTLTGIALANLPSARGPRQGEPFGSTGWLDRPCSACGIHLAFVARMAEAPPVVAVINSSPDVVDMLRLTLEHAGIAVVSAMTWEIREGEVDLERLITQHGPRVVVYDIAPPYQNNWLLFQHMRSLPALKNLQFVLTSTNAAQVEHLAKGDGHRIYEIVGKPFDLDQVVAAVREALKARATR